MSDGYQPADYDYGDFDEEDIIELENDPDISMPKPLALQQTLTPSRGSPYQKQYDSYTPQAQVQRSAKPLETSSVLKENLPPRKSHVDTPFTGFRRSSIANANVHEPSILAPSRNSRPPGRSSQFSRTLSGSNSRQTTMLGHILRSSPDTTSGSSSGNRQHRTATEANNEEATHHDLDRAACETYIYPINKEVRDYQLTIVRRALFNNILCSLPTGTGKTFIASVVMYNWYRWTKSSKILFVAPTKPLVDQQIEAVYETVAIPRSHIATHTGGIKKEDRTDNYLTKRVFFGTAETFVNDLRKELLDARSIACVIIDEAHRSKQNYASVQMMNEIRKVNTSFRVLALTATPGSTVESIQEVINNLSLSGIEARTEDSTDVQPYMKKKTTEEIIVEDCQEQTELFGYLREALKQPMDDLIRYGILNSSFDVKGLSAGLINNFSQKLKSGGLAKSKAAGYYKISNALGFFSKYAYAIQLLRHHGVRPFYNYLEPRRQEFEKEKHSSSKTSMSSRFFHHPALKKCLKRCLEMFDQQGFTGSNKLTQLANIVQTFFMDAKEQDRKTNIIIFSEFRDSAKYIMEILKNCDEELVRPSLFVGQSGIKNKESGFGVEGMTQKRQREVIQSFRMGQINTLVATSIGEEGLDIGEVDMIIMYDSSSSPIRALQRLGRTGRKRNGQAVLLLTDLEKQKWSKALDNYKHVQKKMSSGEFEFNIAPRIIPRDIECECVRKLIEKPTEEEEADIITDARKKRKSTGKRTKSKAPNKKFRPLPQGARTGFVSAGDLVGEKDLMDDERSFMHEEESREAREISHLAEDSPICNGSPFLDEEEEQTLMNCYMSVYTGKLPESDEFEVQACDGDPVRSVRAMCQTSLVGHSSSYLRFSRVIHEMDRIAKKEDDDENIRRLQNYLEPENITSPLSVPQLAGSVSSEFDISSPRHQLQAFGDGLVSDNGNDLKISSSWVLTCSQSADELEDVGVLLNKAKERTSNLNGMHTVTRRL